MSDQGCANVNERDRGCANPNESDEKSEDDGDAGAEDAWIFDLSSFNLKPNICSKMLGTFCEFFLLLLFEAAEKEAVRRYASAALRSIANQTP